MKVGIVREIGLGERRVAATPETTKRLLKLGFEVVVESGAGELASFRDEDYVEAGASIEPLAKTIWETADVLLKVRPPEAITTTEPAPDPASPKHEAEMLREGATLISFIWPSKNPELLAILEQRKATALAVDMIPRITRAQKMDALSSMANIAGYRSVIEAASFFGRFFTGQMTAAGKVPPAKVLVIGAGVAGLSAIGAARSLGAIVRAFDTRPGVKEQVESMGAEFLTVTLEEDGAGEGGYAKQMSPEFIAAEMALFAEQAREVDIIITTALIPGKAAPILLTSQLVESMRPGSVIVDLAAENGGNCALTEPGKVKTHRGVTLIGYVDLPSRLAPTASQLYGANLCHMLADMGGGASWHIDKEDEVIAGALVMEDGVRWTPPKAKPKEVIAIPKARSSSPPQSMRAEALKAAPSPKASKGHGHGHAPSGKSSLAPIFISCAVIVLASAFAPSAFVAHLTVFVLACFIGWQVVWNVTPALHTPLMSVTNAVSGIILVGGMLNAGNDVTSPATILSLLAILLATINVSGGFLVTNRMLKMFMRSPEDEQRGGS